MALLEVAAPIRESLAPGAAAHPCSLGHRRIHRILRWSPDSRARPKGVYTILRPTRRSMPWASGSNRLDDPIPRVASRFDRLSRLKHLARTRSGAALAQDLFRR